MKRKSKDHPERKCAFSGCGIVFKPSRKWQAYHTRECQQLSYIDRTRTKANADLAELKRRVSVLETADLEGRILALEKTLDNA